MLPTIKSMEVNEVNGEESRRVKVVEAPVGGGRWQVAHSSAGRCGCRVALASPARLRLL